MAIQSSGAISISEIQTEFGGENPISLSEYYRDGDYTTSNNTSVPTSGAISLSNFYGATGEITVTSEALINGLSNRKEMLASDFISSGGVLGIPANFWVWSDDTTVAALTIDIPCTVNNYGKIIGKGGTGVPAASAQQVGGPAIKINSGVSGVTVVNKPGAYIAGGGGASDGGNSGGGGAGGGAAKYYNYGGGAGGTLNAKGANGVGAFGNYGQNGQGGGAGGSGAGADSYNIYIYAVGGGGGRILPGTGGAAQGSYGGAGGSAGNAGGNSGTAAGGTEPAGPGGGGWGAYGGGVNSGARSGSGGGKAGGKAVEDSGVSYTLSNSGTIYGGT
jgi:hypothetical protein